MAKKKSIFDTIRDTASRVYDQVNPLDNGRTFKQQTPTNSRSTVSQVLHNGLTNTVGNVLYKPVANTLSYSLIEPTRSLVAQNTGNPYAQAAAEQRKNTALHGSIPGVAIDQITNLVQSGYNLGFKAPVHDLAGDKRGAEQARVTGLQEFNRTAPGQLVRPVQYGIANSQKASKEKQQQVGLDTKATGAQKYFADPVMGAVGTAGIVAGGAKSLEKARPTVQETLRNAKEANARMGQGGYIQAVPEPKTPTPNTITTAPTKTLKTRGFQKNIERTGLPEKNDTAQQVVESISGYTPIKNKNTLRRAADNISKDPAIAYAKIVTKPTLDNANDVATANLLLRDAIERGDSAAAVQIGRKLSLDGTQLGQAIQAYSTFKRTTPEGVVTYASRKAQKAGRDLTPEQGKALVDKAQVIADMPEGLDKAKATRDLLGDVDKVGRTWRNTVQEILATPKSLMATADLSAPLRQGAILGSRYPQQFARAAVDSVKYFGSPRRFEQAMYDISQRPTYPVMQRSKLAVDGAQALTGTEEQFMKSLLETDVAKRLGVGHIVGASDRAYSGFLTKFRADVFDRVLSDAKGAGVQLDNKAIDSLSRFINSASGRGSLGSLERHAGLLSQALFSPRLWKSRLDTLNPVYYARLDPLARKLALQSAASFTSIVTTVLGVAAAAGAEVQMDPRSADFAKIKVGNTRYDILGGLQQNMRVITQLVTGEKINSTTGEIQTLGPDRGFGKPSRLDLLYQFIENKENPVISFATKMLRGTDPAGNPINPATEAGKLVVPLNAQSIYETAKDQKNVPKAALMNVPGVFGVGVQTYGAGPADKAAQKEAEKYKSTSLDSPEGQKFLKLSGEEQRKAALTDPNAKKFYDQKKTLDVHNRKELVLPDGLDKETTKTLNRFNRLTAPEKQQLFAKDNAAQYQYDLAQYNKNKALGNYTKSEDYAAQQKLAKGKVGSGYSQDTRTLYGMSLDKLADYDLTDEDINQLYAYDAALQDAGIISKSKFKNTAPGQNPSEGGGSTKSIGSGVNVSFGSRKASPAPRITAASTKRKVSVKPRSRKSATLKIKRG
jgi:hypothetical protein